MRSRDTGLRFHIDTNRINARQNLDYMNLLEGWRSKGVITMDMSETVKYEVHKGLNINRIEKARRYWSSLDFSDTPEEKQIIKCIESILFPSGVQNRNQENDVRIVFNAKKYMCYLITNDGDSKQQPRGILGSSEYLKISLGIKVLRDKEAVSLVKHFIKSRDMTCHQRSQRFGLALPDWVGND